MSDSEDESGPGIIEKLRSRFAINDTSMMVTTSCSIVLASGPVPAMLQHWTSGSRAYQRLKKVSRLRLRFAQVGHCVLRCGHAALNPLFSMLYSMSIAEPCLLRMHEV